MAEGKRTEFLFSADTLDRFLVPALSITQLLCGVLGLVVARNMFEHHPNKIAPHRYVPEKLEYHIGIGLGCLFFWNIITAILGFLSITTTGDKLGRGMLVLVASSLDDHDQD